MQQQTHPKVMTKMVKKCLTDQRFIRKRNTTYKIGTLNSPKCFKEPCIKVANLGSGFDAKPFRTARLPLERLITIG